MPLASQAALTPPGESCSVLPSQQTRVSRGAVVQSCCWSTQKLGSTLRFVFILIRIHLYVSCPEASDNCAGSCQFAIVGCVLHFTPLGVPELYWWQRSSSKYGLVESVGSTVSPAAGFTTYKTPPGFPAMSSGSLSARPPGLLGRLVT